MRCCEFQPLLGRERREDVVVLFERRFKHDQVLALVINIQDRKWLMHLHGGQIKELLKWLQTRTKKLRKAHVEYNQENAKEEVNNAGCTDVA